MILRTAILRQRRKDPTLLIERAMYFIRELTDKLRGDRALCRCFVPTLSGKVTEGEEGVISILWSLELPPVMNLTTQKQSTDFFLFLR